MSTYARCQVMQHNVFAFLVPHWIRANSSRLKLVVHLCSTVGGQVSRLHW